MVLASQGDAAARDRLRSEILDWPSWEESILFACDRLSRADAAGAQAVALAIEKTLGIDPILAADMIYRAAPAAWSHIADRMVRFARRWHVPGTVDQAVRFMLTSGRPEFASLLWPLISNADDQVHLEALRGAERFRPAVLGPDPEAMLRYLPDAVRKNVLSEIASNSGFDGMELAATVAAQDSNTDVVVAVIQALEFRRADRLVNRILASVSDDVWRALGEDGYPEELTDGALNTRLAAEREKVAAQKNDPARVLLRLTRGNLPGAKGKIAALVGSKDFDAAAGQTGHALGRAVELFPAEVAAGMVERIVADLPLPYDVEKLLDCVATIDSGPVADIAVDPNTSDDRLNAAVSIVGPTVIGTLIDRFLDMHDQFKAKNWQLSEPERNAYHRLDDLIALSRQESFLAAWLERARSAPPQQIRLMAEMLVRRGRNSQPKPPPISGEGNRSALRAVLTGWIDTFLAAPNSKSGDFGMLARVVERLADAHFTNALHEMLERDLKHSEAALAAFIASRGGGGRSSDDSTHKMQYQHAFAALAGPEAIDILKGYLLDLRFGQEAALALAEIWRQTHPVGEKKPPFAWNDFTTVTARRAEPQESDPPPTSDFAEEIFATVRLMGDPGKSDADQKHAIGLAAVALGLPHGDKREDIDRLLGLPQSAAFKQRLATTIVLAGKSVPASFLMTGVRELMEIAKTEAWRLADNRGELMGWIELFPFSDDLAATMEAIALLPEHHREPWQLRRLLEAIPHAPASAALDLLERLAVWSPPIMDLYEWLNALLKLRTEASAMVLLAHIGAGRLNKTATNEFRTAEVLASLATTYPAVRGELLQRCRSMPPGAPKSLIERAVAELGTDEALMVLLETFAAEGRRDNGLLANVVRKLAIGQRPADGWAGAYEEFRVPLTDLRKRLFGMVITGDVRAALAEYCLNEIEEHRDHLGRINDEPRHPDLSSGLSWPRAAAEPVPISDALPAAT